VPVRDRNRRLQQLLAAIVEDARYTANLTGRAEFDSRVMAAMNDVPHDEFVPADLQESAFENRPLPIGEGQTISQPYIVALMTDLLNPQARHKVLEIGTGCGYQTAVLASLVESIYTIEIVETLQRGAEQRLHKLGFDNVIARVGDGYSGWSEHAPYDSIIVTAACSEIPPPLIDQLRAGGRLVAPVGRPLGAQQLVVVEKSVHGEITTRDVLPVAFVPLTGRTQEDNEDSKL